MDRVAARGWESGDRAAARDGVWEAMDRAAARGWESGDRRASGLATREGRVASGSATRRERRGARDEQRWGREIHQQRGRGGALSYEKPSGGSAERERERA
ncbi:hypothetical protein O6H91_Y160600 [Diphasiastrum complanatum]|nr:hypothetical protein O6H91_Y160600 [Diphasiastrum complanatum]